MADAAAAYRLSREQADVLAGLLAMPTASRAELLERYAARHGQPALLDLFAQALGMANSVVANNRDAIELFGLSNGTLHPHTAHQVNLPTMIGACQGARIARDAKGMCHGCAFRRGSAANQSPITTLDAADCVADGTPFLCHDEPPGAEIRRACRGYVAARRSGTRA